MRKFQINQRVQTIPYLPEDIIELGTIKETLLPSSDFIPMYQVLMDGNDIKIFYENELKAEDKK
jgi:hypothetical protein